MGKYCFETDCARIVIKVESEVIGNIKKDYLLMETGVDNDTIYFTHSDFKHFQKFINLINVKVEND